MITANSAPERDRARVGLCFDCQHARRVPSVRGSTFYLCDRSEHDPSYAKYPRLPMIECPGYEHGEPLQPE